MFHVNSSWHARAYTWEKATEEDLAPRGRLQAALRLLTASELRTKQAEKKYGSCKEDASIAAEGGNPVVTSHVKALATATKTTLMIWRRGSDNKWTLYEIKPPNSNKVVWLSLEAKHYKWLRPKPDCDLQLKTMQASALTVPNMADALAGSGGSTRSKSSRGSMDLLGLSPRKATASRAGTASLLGLKSARDSRNNDNGNDDDEERRSASFPSCQAWAITSHAPSPNAGQN